jgi:hypothetical protein
MANNNLNGSENILVKVDENNLIYIDPNSVVNGDTVEPRGVSPENYVMYVNLEADLVPRSILTATGDQNLSGKLLSIAKGTLNFLKNQNGQDYDTSWTEAFSQIKEEKDSKGNVFNFQNDSSGQSFGIDSINISIKGANFIPQITINFIDVRGKTLFESPQNSPYKAFFHLPWPIFYLTIKGYYGKAIRYRLHMTKFTSKYNETNGNFDITTTFVGSTYAYMNDIPLSGMLNAPYMYYIESDSRLNFNPQTGTYEKKIKKSSKGYSILKTVYDEYKTKGLIPKDFPIKTLREVITIAKSLDKILEREIFDQVVDFKLFNGVKEFEKKIIEFETSINTWSDKYLTNQIITPFIDNPKVNYFVQKGNEKERGSLINIIGSTTNESGSLKMLIANYRKALDDTKISSSELIKDQKINVNFKNVKIDIREIDHYYRKSGSQYVVARELIIDDIKKIQTSFVKERDKLQKSVEEKMNTIIRNKTTGIGFDPTIRNIFAVILANADVYIRLLKDVHKSSFDASEKRKKYFAGLIDEAPGGNNNQIYPWPEVKKLTGTDKRKVIAYPGDTDLLKKLKSDDKILWPEVDFVENFVGVSTKRIDTLAEKEGGVGNVNFIFESNDENDNYSPTSNLLSLSIGSPYSNKSPSNIFYEIYERAKMTTLLDTFDNNYNTLHELANIEFDNIKFSFNEDYDLVNLIKGLTTVDELKNYLLAYSPNERYPYYTDKLPTVSYIKDLSENSFKISQFYGPVIKKDKLNLYSKILNTLSDYKVEDYRKNIYPFNSTEYLSYLNKTSFEDSLKFTNLFQINTNSGFICTPIEPKSWVNSDYITNLFSQKLEIGSSKINILNTPYFHKQLFNDYLIAKSAGKYVGSAYLLLNSLPFKDLEDTLEFSPTPTEPSSSVNMASMFKEVGSTHYVPYHLMLKWGSIYHRYKKYLLDGIDILNGFTISNVNTTTTSIDGAFFFSGSTYTGTTYNTFTVSGTNINYSTEIGIHPYYENTFHEIINGYSFYDYTLGNTSFSAITGNGTYISRKRNENELNYRTTVIDNSKIYNTSTYFTLLPCDGANAKTNLNTYDDYLKGEQSNFRVIWSVEQITDVFSGKTFNTPKQYVRSSSNNNYSISDDNKKVIDLIATFSPDILSTFESYFIEFASERLNVEVERKILPDYIEPLTENRHYIRYDNFQNLLKSIVTVDKTKVDSSDLFTSIGKIQEENLKIITEDILKSDNLIKITLGNPKEINPHVWDGFTKFSIGNTFTYNEYNESQYIPNKKFIEQYVGEVPLNSNDYYKQFFTVNNIELSEENILQFRPLVLIFAGWVKSKGPSYTPSKSDFQSYVATNVLSKAEDRLIIYLTQILRKINSNEFISDISSNNKITPTSGYNDALLKVELYNHFKSFNDKWVAGNSIGQRGLLEEFLFLDKANKDIGSLAYLSLDKLIALEDPKNDNADLYSVISMLLSGTGFDMRALPAYVNFYGTNFTNKSKVTSSKQVAKNIFGTFLEVDYQESSPKIVVQYTGPTSKHLELSDISKDYYKFKNDSGNLFTSQGGPLTITIPDVFATGDLAKSNKVVAFEVSVGDQNQGIFKGVRLDQTSIRNTSESFSVIENMGRSESGAGTYNVDIALFDIYRQASYSCEVSCMGNVMIQPTMFFYLKNIPMFRGSYWITEVSHNIQGNKINTTFKGSRIPYASLPDPKDSFFSSYRVYFDKITNQAVAKVKQASELGTTTEMPLVLKDGRSSIIDMGPKNDKNETIVDDIGVTTYGIPYNGFQDEKYIQLVSRKGEKGKWLRARAVEMGGKKNTLSDDTQMQLLINADKWGNEDFNDLIVNSSLKTWKSVQEASSRKYFYATKFLSVNSSVKKVANPNKIVSTNTIFRNPENGKLITVPPIRKATTGSLTMTVDNITGPISIGPSEDGYGVSLSKKLMRDLGLKDGDVVYFRDDYDDIYK